MQLEFLLVGFAVFGAGRKLDVEHDLVESALFLVGPAGEGRLDAFSYAADGG